MSSMKVAILAGGKGTRFLEETQFRPKPMIRIGGRPILWHILMQFHACGYSDFAVALGYRADFIKRWFREQRVLTRPSEVRVKSRSSRSLGILQPNWNVELVETGLETQTGGRIKALGPTLGQQPFILAWGDGVSDVDFQAVAAFHRDHGKLATMVVVRPPARFGHVELEGDRITTFREKPERAEGWINGGMFVLQPEALHYIADETTQFEKEPLEGLARDGELMAFRHEGFWHCMDTMHDHKRLEEIWATGQAPWQTWRSEECVFSSREAAGM